jgi:hypothetical protein
MARLVTTVGELSVELWKYLVTPSLMQVLNFHLIMPATEQVHA